MRVRNWIILALVVCVGLLAALLLRRLAHEANQRLLTVLSTRLEPLARRGWSVDSVEVRFGSVHFYGVRYRGRTPYELHVEDVRIGYSITNLIRHGFRPASLPNSILLYGPSLTVHFYTRLDSSTAPDSIRREERRRMLRNLAFLRNVVISDGIVSYVDSAGTVWRLFDEVDGWLFRADETGARLQLAARPRGSSEITVRALGRIDLSTGRMDTVQFHIREYDVGENFPFLLPDFLEVTRGRLQADFRLAENPAFPQGFDLTGQLEFRGGRARLRGSRITLDSLQFAASIDGWDLRILFAKLLLNGSPVEAEGSVHNLLNPQFDVTLRSRSFDLRRFERGLEFRFPTPIRGKAVLDAKLTGDHRNPRVEGRFFLRRGRIGRTRLEWVSAHLLFADSVLHVQALRASAGNSELRGDALFDFREEQRPVDVRIAVVTDLARLSGGSSTQTSPDDTIRLHFAGAMASEAFQLGLRADLHSRQGPPLVLEGKGALTREGGQLDLQAGPPARFSGKLRWEHGKERLIDRFAAYLEELEQISPYLGLPALPAALEQRLSLRLTARGTPDRVEAACQVLSGFGPERRTVLDLSGEVVLASSGDWEGDFELQYQPGVAPATAGRLRFYVPSSERSYYGTLTLGHQMSAVFHRASPDSQFMLQLRIRDASLASLVGLPESAWRGWVDTDLAVAAGADSVSGLLRLRLKELYGHGVGPYSAFLRAERRNGLIRVDSLRLCLGDRTLTEGQARLNLAQKHLSAALRSDTLRVSTLLRTLGLPDTLLDGLLTVWARAEGQWQRPALTGEVLISDGRLLFEPFDLFRLAFAPDTLADSLSTPAIQLEEISLVRTGVYRLEGDGTIPLRRDTPMRINLGGEANVLRIVADALGFLREPSCRGHLQLEIDGTPRAPRFESLEARFTQGRSRFSSVLPEVTQARGEVRLEPDGFVHLVDLSGKMGGEPFRITNARASQIQCARALQDFNIPGLGVSLGAFLFETGPRGVPLNLYGLQEKGDFGLYEFLGADTNETFVVAGPWEKPLIRGLWKLRDVSFQYPFIEGARGKKNWVLDFLARAEWDLRLIAVRNVRYVRSIPSAVDNVYVNLLIDEGGDGILLTGCPREGTFRLVGRIESTQGFVEYLDMNFRVESIGAEFDRQSLYPVVWGRARATVTDTTGLPSDIYLTLVTEDYSEERRLDDLVRDRKPRGRWGQIRFQLSSDNPNLGRNESEILAALGYSDHQLRQKAAEVVGMSADNWLFRPIMRPFEKSLQRVFGFDLVRFRSRIARNFIEWNLANQPYSPWYLLRSTRWEMGKYLLNDLFLTYTGEVETGFRYEPHQQQLGFRHTLGLEYRISPDLILEMVYDYDSLLLWRKTDRKILLRHSFPF